MVRNISEAKAELSALVEEVQKGGELFSPSQASLLPK